MKRWLRAWICLAFISVFVIGCPGMAGEALGAECASEGQWTEYGGKWYWLEPEGRACTGWLSEGGRTYYLDTEDGAMSVGWREIDGEWYYFHEDGGLNLGELVLDETVYNCSEDTGILLGARRLDDTDGGTYEAGCYDEEEQALFDALNEEKESETEEGRERYASFQMDAMLNKAAAHRLEQAALYGYADNRIPGEGELSEYLASIPYRKSASVLELYLRSCEDGSEAYEKLADQLEKKSGRQDRKYSLSYYRYVGLAHREDQGSSSFMVILMR